MPARTNFYTVNRSLLNPDFEAYKLSSATVTTASYQLPSAVTLAGLNPADATGPLLGYKELKDRLDSQRLVHGSQPGHLAYIDDTGFVILVVFDEVSPGEGDRSYLERLLTCHRLQASRKPTFNPIHRINAESSQVARDSAHLPSLPSLSALNDGRWLVADGHGRLVVLATIQQGRRWSASLAAQIQLKSMESSRILSAKETNGGTSALVLVQGCRKEPLQQAESSDRGSRTKAAVKTVFDVSLLELNLSASPDPQPERLKLLWSVTGEEAVYYARLGEKAEDAHLLLSESTFIATDTARAEPGEQTEVSAPSQAAPSVSSSAHPSSRPSPFTWLQTPDSVTVIFQLPSTLSKRDIRVHFSPYGLSLTLASTALDQVAGLKIQEITEDGPENEAVTSSDPLAATAQLILSGRYRSRSLWAPIEASSSVWTWEQVGEGEQTKGLLTLHLEKKDEGTRWLKVFESKAKAEDADTVGPQRPMIGGSNSITRKSDETRLYELDAQIAQQTSDDEDLDDPPEIMDPSELAMMIEGLDKYTADGEFDDPAIPRPSGPTLSTERESLLRDQLEPEDAVVGKRLQASLITGSRDGARVTETTRSDQTHYCLAEPLPHFKADGTQDHALAVRHELDGLVVTPDDKTASTWQHVDTLPALSFVLASKRDLNRVSLHRRNGQSGPRSIVLAFESSRERTEVSTSQDQPSSASAGNLFVYYGQPGATSKGKYAESRVIRLGIEEEGASGALMGAAAVDVRTSEDSEEKETVLVCLCERRLLTLRGVL